MNQQLLLTYSPPLLLTYVKRPTEKYDPRLSELRDVDLGLLMTFIKSRFGATRVELKF